MHIILKKVLLGPQIVKLTLQLFNNRYSNFRVTTIKYIMYKAQDLNVLYMLLSLQTRSLAIFFLCVNHII